MTAPVTYTAPVGAPGARKTWRKTITGVDPNQTKGFAIQGDFIEPGATYRSTPGGLILGFDEIPGTGNVVTIWHVTDDGALAETKKIIRKGPWAGAATIKTIAKLVGAHPWTGAKPTRTAYATNNTTQACVNCHATVPAGEGVQTRDRFGRTVIAHRLCPPKRNRHPGPCHRCGGWLDPDEGILIPRREHTMMERSLAREAPLTMTEWETLSGVVALHDGPCPPAEQRKPAPPTPNRYAEPCARCWHVVPAGTGIYANRTVTHPDGQCPPTGIVWEIGYGRPSRFNPRPERGYTIGQVLRADVADHNGVFPADTPGYRRTSAHNISAIVVVVAEAKPVYCRDEDGNNPADLLGADGWYFRARVRPATPGEAADILAAEAQAADRDALRMRAAVEFVRAGDAETPAQTGPLLSLPGVRIEPARVGSLAFAASWGAYIHLRVDRDAAAVWVMTYNGADGDDWSASNCGAYIARRVPLTTDRAVLVDELAAAFGEIE